jgi:ABC-2 type transport system permease protein
MAKLLTILWKDIAVLLQDRTSLLLVVAGPLVLTVGMGLVTGSFGGSDAPAVSSIPLLIVDEDGGELAGALVDVFNSVELADLLDPETASDEATAVAAVQAGDAVAAVIIPAGFSDNLIPDPASGRTADPVALQVYGDPGSPVRSAIVRTITEEFIARVESGVATVGIALEALSTSGAVPIGDLPEAGRQLGEQVFAGGDVPNVSLIRVRTESGTPAGGEFNLLSYFAPSFALFFLMYAVTLGARTLVTEKRQGTLARMLVAPVTTWQVLGGKVAAIFVGGFLQLAALVLLTSLLIRVNWGEPLGVLLLIVAAALAATGWGVLIASAAGDSGQIGVLGMALTLLFGVISGSFFPPQGAGSLLDRLSRITPNRWAMDGFLSLIGGEGVTSVLEPVGVLLVMAAILFVISGVVLRRRQTSLLTG